MLQFAQQYRPLLRRRSQQPGCFQAVDRSTQQVGETLQEIDVVLREAPAGGAVDLECPERGSMAECGR
jgi:hypothetical protein